MQSLADIAGFLSISRLHYSPLVMAQYFLSMLLGSISFAWTRHLCRNEEALWPSSHRTPISIKLCGDNRWQKEADAQVSGRGGVQCPHLTLREREGERDGAMKMTDGNTNGRAVIGGNGEGGERRETRDNADSWTGLPVRPSLVFRLDLQVLDGTLAGAVLENKNRCHKTPLRLGFASVMTPLETLRVWCSQQKPVRYALGVVFITNSAATYLPSYHLTMMENSFFVFSTQKRVVHLSIFLNVQLCAHLWQNQTYMFNEFETRFDIMHLVRYSRKRFQHRWEWGNSSDPRLSYSHIWVAIKHVSYLWPDICRALNRSFSE